MNFLKNTSKDDLKRARDTYEKHLGNFQKAWVETIEKECKDQALSHYAKNGDLKNFECRVELRSPLSSQDTYKWLKNRYPNVKQGNCGSWNYFFSMSDDKDHSYRPHGGSSCTFHFK